VARIAILDSGVHISHPHVGNIVAGFNATASGAENEYLDFLGHGTAVTGAIHGHAPAAELLIVKIFNRSLRCDLATIERGILWALEQRAEIVNLSLGTSNPDHADPLKQLVGLGAFWVSAAESDGAVYYPGVLPGVAGVIADSALERDQYRKLSDGRFAASPYPRPIPGVPKEKNLQGISFAVANLTGLLAREL
jgi:hypothetical protein